MKVYYIPDPETWSLDSETGRLDPPDPNLFMAIYDPASNTEFRINRPRRRVQPSNLLKLNYGYTTLLYETFFDLNAEELAVKGLATGVLYVVLGHAALWAYEFLKLLF